jgi:hypothetical protein
LLLLLSLLVLLLLCVMMVKQQHAPFTLLRLVAAFEAAIATACPAALMACCFCCHVGCAASLAVPLELLPDVAHRLTEVDTNAPAADRKRRYKDSSKRG